MTDPQLQSITVNGVPIQWNPEGKGLTFFGVDSIILWKNPSLISILEPLKTELGEELYSLIVEYEASQGTYEDYYSMVNSLGKTFEEGFLNWGKAVSAAGWGVFSIVSIDWKQKEAIIQIENPWEMTALKVKTLTRPIPFLSGKVSGIFGHAFKTNCRSQTLEVMQNKDGSYFVTVKIYPSQETLESALLQLHNRRKTSGDLQLRAMNSALQRSQHRLLEVAAGSGVFVWESDIHLNIIYSTPGISNILGIPEAKILGASILELLHPSEIDEFKKRLDFLNTGSDPFIDLRVKLKAEKQEYVWIDLNLRHRHNFSGHLSGYIGWGRDVTNQIQLENQVEAERLRSAHASKMASLGEMAAGIAHEINNPLSVIQALSWKLREDIESNEISTESLKKTLHEIENTVKKIAGIISGMRAFTRSGENDSFVRQSIKKIIDETLIYCKARFNNSQVSLDISISNPEIEINCRPIQIGQIILNLLNNSFDAILNSSEKWIKLQVDEQADTITIRVTDSGKGISKEIAEKVMLPFFTTKDPGKGTGLGLSISSNIAKAHGGKVQLDPTSTNTSFVITLKKDPKKR